LVTYVCIVSIATALSSWYISMSMT